MPLVSLVELENSLKMNQFINQHHPQFSHHHHHQQQQQQQFQQLQHTGAGHPSVPSPPAYFNQHQHHHGHAVNNNSSNLIANEILNQIHSMNAMNINSKLLTNITNNLMMNGIKPSTASSILSGINLNALSQSIQNKQVNYSRYKTELCRQFSENGECKYGDKCQFAHGFNDLKDVNRHPKYKTDFCKTFHSKGFCPYGPRCHFIHDLSEKFDMSILNVSSSSGSPQTSASQAAHDSMIISKYLNGLSNKAQSDASVSKHEDRNDEKSADTKEPSLTSLTGMGELEVSLAQSHAQSPPMSLASTSSSNCISSGDSSSHVSSSRTSNSSSPISSPPPQITSSCSSSSLSSASSFNENHFPSPYNIYFNNLLSDMSLLSQGPVNAPAPVPRQMNSSLLAPISNLDPAMIQLLRQYFISQQASSNVIKRPSPMSQESAAPPGMNPHPAVKFNLNW